jgi:rod shape determining protein RodA
MAITWCPGTRGPRGAIGLGAAPVRHFDFVLVGAALALSLIGLVMIWSTTRHRIPGDELYFVKRQALFLVLGVGPCSA